MDSEGVGSYWPFATGRIVDACMSGATIDDYNSIIPMNYQYSFLTIKDFEQGNNNEG